MGDRADAPKEASYSAEDLMIVERDVGRLAKYTFDMGGSGDLLSLALRIPPWDDLHEITPEELVLSRLGTSSSLEELARGGPPAGKIQDRFVPADEAAAGKSAKERTAAATAPSGHPD